MGGGRHLHALSGAAVDVTIRGALVLVHEGLGVGFAGVGLDSSGRAGVRLGIIASRMLGHEGGATYRATRSAVEVTLSLSFSWVDLVELGVSFSPAPANWVVSLLWLDIGIVSGQSGYGRVEKSLRNASDMVALWDLVWR